MKIKLRHLMGCFLFIAPLLVSANDANDDLLARLDAIKTISGVFTQSLRDDLGDIIDTSQGNFTLAKPAKIRWNVMLPLEQLIVSNATLLWIYDPDLEQVIIESVDSNSQTTPIALFNGDNDDIHTHYQVSVINNEMTGDTFLLLPIDDASLFRRIEISFDNLGPIMLAITDSLDQVTRIDFHNIVLNESVDPALFEFVVPADTDIINNVQ
ncbi:MAG: outer membrane lipoprotein chaperone LolA [Porticoccaceae bacterium]|nr:outer membrane lipoprotein chaperone LolA [Porticoccaceae bacterium]